MKIEHEIHSVQVSIFKLNRVLICGSGIAFSRQKLMSLANNCCANKPSHQDDEILRNPPRMSNVVVWRYMMIAVPLPLFHNFNTILNVWEST